MFDILTKFKQVILRKDPQASDSACGSENAGSLPTVLNLMVTDRCNSRCVMCNVWEGKPHKELTPSKLSSILNDPLFDNLKFIGVSGGEPTLRNDLSELFRVITRKKGLSGVSLITNALDEATVINQIENCHGICKKARVPFNVMVSLDGVGGVHDAVRGRKGSFENALKVIRHIRDNTNIPLTVACTIVKENVWHIDEVLDFCREEKVYGRFRVAEFINRLYNDDLRGSIRNFDDDERYQLALFFSKLELTYEKDPNVRETYKNIRRMVFEGMPRGSGCPYRSNAVGLDSRGNLLFCSPKSPVLGSCGDNSAMDLYSANLGVREKIIDEHCGACIHDYHAPPTMASLTEAEEEAHYSTAFSVRNALKDAKKIDSAEPKTIDWSCVSSPMIVGWYGTETAGDKAILGNIIEKLRGAKGEARITIASLYPFVTKRTLRELGVEAGIVKTYSKEFLQACQNADAVIMGGGPLMGMEPLGFVLEAFLTAKRKGIPTAIEGCGIGPLSLEPHISAVKEILRLSDVIRVRDRASLAWVIEKTGRVDAICSGDPAVEFVERWKNENSNLFPAPKKNYFVCFLRDLTTEYASGMSPGAFKAFKEKFELELSKMVVYIKERTGLKPLFMPMHTFAVGNDDRDFFRRFTKAYFTDDEYEIGCRVYSAHEILSVMKDSGFNLCMRFHSVLFAETLGVPFAAVDYTGGGKIKAFLEDRRKDELMVERVALSQGDWRGVIDKALRRAREGSN